MAGCMQGFKRANGGLFGDILGDIVPEKKRSVTVENGQVILWAVNAEDIILKKEDIQSFDFLQAKTVVSDIASGGGKQYFVDSYKVVLKDGKSGVLRLMTAKAAQVLAILK